MVDKEKIINIDFQGWPVYKMSLKEIFETIADAIEESEDFISFKIKKDNPILEAYPVIFEDDGMGYGVNERYIDCASNCVYNKDGENRISIFAEAYSKESVEDFIKECEEIDNLRKN